MSLFDPPSRGPEPPGKDAPLADRAQVQVALQQLAQQLAPVDLQALLQFAVLKSACLSALQQHHKRLKRRARRVERSTPRRTHRRLRSRTTRCQGRRTAAGE